MADHCKIIKMPRIVDAGIRIAVLTQRNTPLGHASKDGEAIFSTVKTLTRIEFLTNIVYSEA